MMGDGVCASCDSVCCVSSAGVVDRNLAEKQLSGTIPVYILILPTCRVNYCCGDCACHVCVW